MFKDFLKFMVAVVFLIAICCGILFFIVNQPPARIVHKAAQSRMCVKVMVGGEERPCSDFTDEELRNSKSISVDENYAHYEIIRMALNE